MSYKVVVFDFDGTLIDSNMLKYQAYFELFPKYDRYGRIIRSVLSEIFEESRYIILTEILRRVDDSKEGDLEDIVSELAQGYNDIVTAGAKTCPEMPGAERALAVLAQQYNLYLSSTTPEDALKEIIRYRKWEGYFRDIFGYPRKKSQTLQLIMRTEGVNSSQVVVVGDGDSDERSAAETGCHFIRITPTFPLKELETLIAVI
jgi:phosphoglycolate phosphatase-like HAD superfamily hydrolase